MDREGLVLTRCDCCGKRQWCAVSGTAFCEACCPGAVAAAREEAAQARMDRQHAADAAWTRENVPPAEDDPVGEPYMFREVAHIVFPEWYSEPIAV